MATFTMVATGDSIITRRLSHLEDPTFTDLIALVRQGHAAFANLELTTPRRPFVPGSESGGMWLRCDPFILDELSWMGFNLFNVATNHATDFMVQGLIDTMAELRARSLVFAGGGMTLGEARQPGYLETKGGRVALLAAASTFGTGAHAADPRSDVGGRPGISPLRFKREFVLDPKRMAAMREIDRALGTADWIRRRAGGGAKEDETRDAVRIGETTFVPGEAPAIRTRCERRDLDEIVRWIGDARRGADHVLVSLHAHEGTGPTSNSNAPADFIIEAAHAFVDAGADAVLGHGSHQVRAIEIYQDKPIFYSLGNFMYHSQTSTHVAAEMYERLGLPPTATPQDVHDARSKLPSGEPIAFQADPVYWEAVVPVCRFEEGRLTELTLHPIDLGRQRPRPDRGTPRMAAAAHGRVVLGRLAELSAPFGLTMAVQERGAYAVGVVR